MNTFIIAALTLDGKIAKYPEHNSYSWTCAEDKKFFIEKTKDAGVVILGRKTWELIGKPFEDRLVVVMTRRMGQGSGDKGQGIRGVEFTDKSPAEILSDLENRGFKGAAVAGGAEVYAEFLRADLVDEMFITVHSIIFGEGIDFVSEVEIDNFDVLDTKMFGSKSCLLHVRHRV